MVCCWCRNVGIELMMFGLFWLFVMNGFYGCVCMVVFVFYMMLNCLLLWILLIIIGLCR